MPQFEFSTVFIPQIAWLAIIFVILYFGVVRLTLPKVGKVMQAREDQVAADLDTAEKAKASADRLQADYDAGVAAAQEAARASLTASRAKSAAAIEPKAAPPGPSQEDMAAAQQMTPEQRQEMIRGMVDRLAERLKTDSSDFEGWLRLVRAYAVMGDRDKAREAFVSARNTIGDDADKRKRLDDLAKGLGIEG